jgi:hypothetical protein
VLAPRLAARHRRRRRRGLTPRGCPATARAEYPEDDAKRSAEQLKGIIHDTDGATAQAKLASQLFDAQK